MICIVRVSLTSFFVWHGKQDSSPFIDSFSFFIYMGNSPKWNHCSVSCVSWLLWVFVACAVRT
jgi:hypothetical protein